MQTLDTIDYPKSEVGGMGAVVHEEGVSFRVWAPNAKEVFVVGDFNEWNNEATPLVLEENGHWSVNVPDAQKGQEYKYLLKTAQGNLMRNDPQARQLTSSIGNTIITDTDFDWEDSDNFQMPYFINHEHVCTVCRLPCDHDPRITNRNINIWQTARQEGECLGIACDFDDHWVNLIKTPHLAAPRVTGKRSRTKANHANPGC